MMRNPQGRGIGILERFQFATHSAKAARPVGRPKTRTPAYLAELLRDHAAMAVWFHSVHGRPAKSDAELLSVFLQSEFQRHGLRSSRIDSPDVQARIKTIRNHLSEARQVCQSIPETPLLPGRNANHTDAH